MKLSNTYHNLKEAKEYSDRVLVAFSGGKDSLMTLDLCKRIFKKVECFYMYLVPGLKCIEEPIEMHCEKNKVKLHKLPHFNLSQYFKRGIYAPRIRADRFRYLKQRDIEEYLRKICGIHWIAYGHRMDDSISRRFYLRKCGVNNWKHLRLFPLYNYRKSEVMDYLKYRKIKFKITRFGAEKRKRTTGFDLTSRSILWLKENHPNDYQKVVEFFPDIESIPTLMEFDNDIAFEGQ